MVFLGLEDDILGEAGDLRSDAISWVRSILSSVEEIFSEVVDGDILPSRTTC
jgi:hypothetical protein